MNSKITPRFFVLIGMILFAAISRLIPHPPNFTAVAAMALLHGAYFNNRYAAYMIPLSTLFLTDLILGFHNTIWAVYLSFELVVFIGTLLRNRKKPANILLASVTEAVIFFVITNLAVWLSGTLYPLIGGGFALYYT